MIGAILAWWLASTVVGAAVFPLAWRVFDRLPDRGYGLSRTFGILLGGYLMWLSVSLGILRNNPGGALAGVLLLGVGSALAGRGHWRQIGEWLRANAATVLAMEALFLVAFAGWAVVRAYNPEIVATEKPMELAFLNAILRSPQFPPQDPWLAGNAISYYYLGYVLVAWMTWLTSVPAGVAFNLANAMWFGLVALGSYSVVFNLLGLRYGARRRLAALLGPLMVLFVGNLTGVLEVMHAQHWFWEPQADGSMTSEFWTWLNLDDLASPPSGPPTFPPNRFWFWWQGARVVNDIDLAGEHVEVIDEFPFFSFLLADNHPHVLAVPFAVLALAVALQAFQASKPGGHQLGWFHLSHRVVRSGLIVAFALVALAALAQAAMGYGGEVVPPDLLASFVRSLVLGLAAVAVWAPSVPDHGPGAFRPGDQGAGARRLAGRDPRLPQHLGSPDLPDLDPWRRCLGNDRRRAVGRCPARAVDRCRRVGPGAAGRAPVDSDICLAGRWDPSQYDLPDADAAVPDHVRSSPVACRDVADPEDDRRDAAAQDVAPRPRPDLRDSAGAVGDFLAAGGPDGGPGAGTDPGGGGRLAGDRDRGGGG
jgi:hypothetical protein